MNCLAWLRLKSSRVDLASPIWRMPRFLFQRVLARVRVGMGMLMSPPLKAFLATSSARWTTLASVVLSRSRMRLLTRSTDAAGFDSFLAMLSQFGTVTWVRLEIWHTLDGGV